MAGKKRKQNIYEAIPGVPAMNPVRKWLEDPENTYEKWMDRASRCRNDTERDLCTAKAFVCHDGFFHFVQRFICDRPLNERFHGRMAKFVVGLGLARYPVKRSRLLLAFRSSWKSHFCFGLTTWLCALEYILSIPARERRTEIARLTEELLACESDTEHRRISAEIEVLEGEVARMVDRGESLDGVNIRIGLQSEAIEFAEATIQTCCDIMDKPEYRRYFGTHNPGSGKGSLWGRGGARSAYRTNMSLRDPTLLTISLKTPRVGSHFDVIISDDFQAEKSSGSRVVRENSWAMWKGNFQLLNPPTVSHYSEILAVGTRWHSADNYGKIMRENETLSARDRTEVLILPVCDNARKATCPSIYANEDIASIIAKEGIDKFNTQYLLKPVGGKTQPFQPKDVQNYHSFNFDRSLMYAVTGADFVWVPAARRGDEGGDHAVVMTLLVDTAWRFYLIDVWREQADVRKTWEEIYRQMTVHQSVALGLSKSDQKHVEPEMLRFQFEKKFQFNPTWVSDLKGGEGVDAQTHKARKHIGVLQPIFQTGRFLLTVGHPFFEEELLDAPRGRTDDYLDAAVCCVVAAGSPATAPRYKPAPAGTDDPLNMGLLYDSIREGKPRDFSGKRIRVGDARRFSQRRPRNRTPLP